MNAGRRLLFAIGWLFIIPSYALNTNVRISQLLRFETNNIGDNVSASDAATNVWNNFLETGSAVRGGFELHGNTVGSMTVDATLGMQMWRTHLSSGGLISDYGSTRSIKFNDAAGQYEFMRYWLQGGAHAKVTWGYYVKLNNWTADSQSYDLIFAEQNGGGQFAGFQFYNQTSTTIEAALETQQPGGTSTAYTLQKNKVYWITGKWDQANGANGLASQMIFDPVTWTQVGATQTRLLGNGEAGGSCRDIAIGRYDNHQVAPANSFHWIDNLVIDDTGANFPMFPGSVWMADSTSLTDVTAAYNAAASGGETVHIPAGSSTWATGLSITKSLLTFDGQGSSQTTINLSSTGSSSPTTSSASWTEFSNIRFVAPSPDTAQNRILQFNFGADWFRVHDCVFNNGMIFVTDPFGAVYKCGFTNGYYCFRAQATGSSGQHYTSFYPFVSSSTNFLGIEDCTFYNDSQTGNSDRVVISSQQGALWMIRHCRGDFVKSGGASLSMSPIADAHGNTTGTRGIIGIIMASNQWAFSGGASWSWLVDHRGGTALSYSNVVTGLSASDANRCDQMRIANQDEVEYFQNSGTGIHTNSYHFRNIVNGVSTNVIIGGTGTGCPNCDIAECGIGATICTTAATLNDFDYLVRGITYDTNPPPTLLVPVYPFPVRHDALAVTGGGQGPVGASSQNPGHLGRTSSIGGPP